MKMLRRSLFLILTLTLPLTQLATAATAASAQVPPPRENLAQLVGQLAMTPADNALREKIIRFAMTARPTPAVPEEALRREGRAKFAFKNAKSASDYLEAAREYEEAVRVAPWIRGYYEDLCTILERAEELVVAKRMCEFALIGAEQTSDLRQRIAGLEFGIEKAESPRGRAAARLSQLRAQYGGPVRKLTICGVLLNPHWKCTEDEARGINWVDSTTMNAQPPPRPGTIRFNLVGANQDTIEMKLGDYGWGGDAYRTSCAVDNGPDRLYWVGCPGTPNAGQVSGERVLFTVSDGLPVIVFTDSCSSDGACRRANFFLQPR